MTAKLQKYSATLARINESYCNDVQDFKHEKSYLVPKINERIALIDTEISKVARFQEKLDLVMSKHKISVSYGFSQTMLSAAQKQP